VKVTLVPAWTGPQRRNNGLVPASFPPRMEP